MKKVISVILCAALIVLSFAGCGSNKKVSLIESPENIKIGVVCSNDDQLSVDMKKGFEEALKELPYYERIELDVRNANGDSGMLRNICEDVLKKNDMVVTIGQEASVATKNAREDVSKPIFFIGVRNPVTAHLMSNTISSSNNVTGIMSNVTPDCVFSFASEKVGGQIKKVGLIYNTSEVNPAYEMNEIKDYLNTNSIFYVEGIIANVFDAQQSVIKILSTKIPASKDENIEDYIRTAFVVSSDEVTKKSMAGISNLVKGTGSIAFVIGDAELPNDAFYSIVPVYESLGRKCVTLVDEYINGTSIIALSAQSSDEYNLFQGEPEEETLVDETAQN